MLAQFTTVWTSLLTWFAGIFTTIESLFVTTSGSGSDVTYSLTFVGLCAVVMAGCSLILLAFNLIRSFLPMRG